jgi:MFS family permease
VAVTSWARRLHVDVTPLRESRDFRLLIGAGVVTNVGSFVTLVALPFQAKELTGSYVAVGVLGAVELVPLIVFGLWGGSLSDVWDRRRTVLLTEAALLCCSTALLVNALAPQPQLWLLYVVAALFATFDSLQRPSLDAIVPRVVRHEQLAAAGALVGLRWQIASLGGPALSGLMIAAWGVESAYLLDVASYAVSLTLLWRLRPVPALDAAARVGLQHVGAGVRYAWSRKDLLGTYLVDIAAMATAMPMALFPFVADDLGAPWALGLLYTAPFLGSLLATLTSGWTAHVHRHGRAIVLAAAAWGVGIALFGLADSLGWALLWLVVAGGADMISGIFRSTMWNQTIPDELRGRMAGVELLSYSVGPSVGQLRASAVAAVSSLRFSLVSGGVACVVAVGLLAAVLPSMWRYDDRTSPEAVRERRVRAERAAAEAEREGTQDAGGGGPAAGGGSSGADAASPGGDQREHRPDG